MATAQQFEDLHVWQDARKLVKDVYKATKQREFRRDFGLRDQVTRAATLTLSRRIAKFIDYLASFPATPRRRPRRQP